MQWNVADRKQMAELYDALLACPPEIQDRILTDFFRLYGPDVRGDALKSLMRPSEQMESELAGLDSHWARFIHLVFRGGRQPFPLHIDRLTRAARRHGWQPPGTAYP